MSIATPKVTLIASTQTYPNGWNPDTSSLTLGGMDLDTDSGTSYADELAEFAGRSCYQSFGKPNPATASNVDYIANILRQGHESVLEHASATFYITGISRALTHELIRHRHLSYSQLSQRFVNEEDADIVIPPAMRDNPKLTMDAESIDFLSKTVYGTLVRELQEAGHPRKQAREAARAVLPNMTETRIVVTGNMRAWRDVLARRLDPAADAEIREVSQMILDELRKIAPSSFQDFE